MSNKKISELNPLTSLDSSEELAIVDGNETKRITVATLLTQGLSTVTAASISSSKITYVAGGIATAAIADSAITTAKLGDDQVSAAKISNNAIVVVQSTLPTSGAYTGQLALDTDDNSLYVWSGTAWLSSKAPGSVNAFTDTSSGIINIATTLSSGTATITASIDDTGSAAQFLAGPVGSGGTVGYRTIDGGDLPTATTTSKGGVIVNGGGLTLSTDTIQIDNSVTASSTKHLVTYNANGLINGGAAITSTDLPIATGSARGAVVVSDGLAVDSSGNLSIDNSVTAGTYTKVTVTSKGVVSSGDTLAAADIPDHSAAKLTSGTINTSLIANDSITADKLANESTVKFGGALGSDNVTIFPAGDFKGQLFWDETSLDLYVYTGSAFIPITVLSGNLVNAGTYNANSNLVSSVTTAGSSAGFSAGSALPAPVGANLNHYVVVETSGTGSGAAPAVALAPPDMLLSNGVGTEYRLIDVSNAIAGQTAANISFIASGTIAATDVQAALQEVDTEKLPKAGGTMTGDLNLGTSTNVVFEGSSADDYETTLTVTNPTADRTITLPNVTGTVVTTGDTGSVTGAMIADGAIVNADINASAEIAVSKLANGTARQLLQTDAGGSGVEFTNNVDVPGTLDVTSAATFDSTVAVTGLLSANGKLAYPAGSAAAVSLYSGSDTDTGIYSPGSNQFGIATAGTSRIVVDASGNVGIGESASLDALLVIKGNSDASTTPSIRLKDGSDSREAWITNASGDLSLNVGGNDNTAHGTLKLFDSGILDYAQATGSKLRIDSSGRLLVGTTTANGSMTVNMGTDKNISFTGGVSEVGNVPCLQATNTAGSSIVSMAFRGTDLRFATGSAQRMLIDSSGNTSFTGTVDSEKFFRSTRTASSGGELFFQGKVGSTVNCQLAADGSATFGTSSLGGSTITATNDSSSPTIYARNHTGSGKVFSGYDSPGNENCTILANGSATFAGTTVVGNYSSTATNTNGVRITASGQVNIQRETGASTDNRFQILDGQTVKASIKNDGSATFGGGLINLAANGGVSLGSAGTANGVNLSLIAGTSPAASSYTLLQGYQSNGSTAAFLFKANGSAYFAEDIEVGNWPLRSDIEKGRINIYSNVSNAPNLLLRKTDSAANSARFLECNNSSDTTVATLGANGAAFFASGAFDISSTGVTTVTETIRVNRTGTTQSCFLAQQSGVNKINLQAGGNATFAGNITAANVSDIRFKENITDANPQLADAVALGSQLKNFDWNDDAPLNEELRARRFLGLVAQEAEKVCPGLTYTVPRTKQGAELTPEVVVPAVYETRTVPAVLDEEGKVVEAETTEQVLVTEEQVTPATYEELDDSYKAINHDILVMKLLGAVAELSAKVEALEAG